MLRSLRVLDEPQAEARLSSVCKMNAEATCLIWNNQEAFGWWQPHAWPWSSPLPATSEAAPECLSITARHSGQCWSRAVPWTERVVSFSITFQSGAFTESRELCHEPSSGSSVSVGEVPCVPVCEGRGTLTWCASAPATCVEGPWLPGGIAQL